MITGYNTDIEFGGVVYHVQTEDKGASTPVIMSLVYDRGTILASKRSPYDDLLNGGFDESVLSERLQKQHKLMCAAVSAGRIEDLKQMSAKNLKAAAAKRSGRKKKGPEAVEADAIPPSFPQITIDADAIPPTLPQITIDADAIPPTLPQIDVKADLAELDADVLPEPQNGFAHEFSTGELMPIAKPADLPMPALKPNPVGTTKPTPEPIVEVVDVFAEESPVLVEAVEAVSDLAGTTRPDNDKLSIDVLGESRFTGGEQKDICIMVCRGSGRKVVGHAEIMVKVMGSSFRPVICHSKTDTNGLAMVKLKVPHFQSGRATVVVRAISSGEEVEIRRAVEHG